MSAETIPLYQTERLDIRRLLPGDLEALMSVYGDADAMRWVGDGEPLDEAQCCRWLEVTADNYRRRGYGMAALQERSSSQVIGFCGLVHPGGQLEAEIKYALARPYWGQGYATEAVQGMIAYGHLQHGLTHIIATAAQEHVASHRVLLKAGLSLLKVRENDDGSFTHVFAWNAPAPAALQSP